MDIPVTQALGPQVGGHAGVLTTEDGSLLIKPALPQELEFYYALRQDPALDDLRSFTPTFLGTLKLEGKVESSDADLTSGAGIEHVDAEGKESIVLENLSYPFLKPNILDIKLGTVLYDDSASPEKVARMEKTAKETTSLETGVRLTGFQVYDNITGLPVNTPKSYGKSIKAHELGEGIAKFFPVGSPAAASSDSTDAPASSSGLPLESLLPILQTIREEIAEIKQVFSSLELRMVGGSLLIIYEADWKRAEDSIEKYLLGDSEDEEEKDNDKADKEDEEEEVAEDDEDEDSEDTDPATTIGPPFVVKLIDFAHTKFVPGQGPDEGVILGLDTVLRLLDARLKEITPP
ncbi:SAICAR synthase-like protein [Agrocybe pediades]|nr:SAICAR synthase-like protein [Agrocybe pediades]